MVPWILLFAALEVSYFPYAVGSDGAYAASRSFEIGLEGEVRLINRGGFYLFAGGAVAVPTEAKRLGLWWPDQLDSTVELGVRMGPVTVAFEHWCVHPVTAWGTRSPRNWDRAAERVYVRVETGGSR